MLLDDRIQDWPEVQTSPANEEQQKAGVTHVVEYNNEMVMLNHLVSPGCAAMLLRWGAMIGELRMRIGRDKNRRLADDLAKVINLHSRENASNSPDFVLGEFLSATLSAFEEATRDRDKWYGISPHPGGASTKIGQNTTLEDHVLHILQALSSPTVSVLDEEVRRKIPSLLQSESRGVILALINSGRIKVHAGWVVSVAE